MTEEKKRVAREFYIMSPTLEQEFNGAKQYVRMCIEIPHFRSNFSGEYFIAIDKTAYQQAIEQIEKLEMALKNLSRSLGLIGGMTIDEVVTGYINKNGGPIDEIDQALAELKKWRGENG